MNIKITYIFLLTFLYFGGIFAQNEKNQVPPTIDIVSSDSEINLSTAEFQSLIEEIMEFKRKRQAQATAIAFAQQRAFNRATAPISQKDTIAIADQTTELKVAEMERLLVQMNNRLNERSTTPEQNEELVEKKDLDLLEIKLKEEINTIKKAIYEASLNPPAVAIETENQADYEKAQRDYYFKYATQMIEMRRSMDSLSWRIDQLSAPNDYAELEAQLTRMETKMERPIIVQTQNEASGKQEKIVIPADNTAYMDAQFKDIRRMIKDLESKNSKTVPVIVKSDTKETTPTNNIDTKAMMDQWNAQMAELKAMIAELKTVDRQVVVAPAPVATPPTKVVTPVVEKEIVYVEVPGATKYVEVPGEVRTVDRIERIIAGNEKRKLFYDNNATQIKTEYRYILEETTSILQNSPELDIILVGFASNQGSVDYNQKLSRKRAETVKTYLINKGIAANRILAKYNGVDFEVGDPASARRVDMVLVRR